MREFTAIITRSDHVYAAICPELGITNVVGASVEEARDNLINAMQRHIDDVCESMSSTRDLTPAHGIPRTRPEKSFESLTLKVPEYLLTRN